MCVGSGCGTISMVQGTPCHLGELICYGGCGKACQQQVLHSSCIGRSQSRNRWRTAACAHLSTSGVDVYSVVLEDMGVPMTTILGNAEPQPNRSEWQKGSVLDARDMEGVWHSATVVKKEVHRVYIKYLVCDWPRLHVQLTTGSSGHKWQATRMDRYRLGSAGNPRVSHTDEGTFPLLYRSHPRKLPCFRCTVMCQVISSGVA